METHFAIELVSDNEGRIKGQEAFAEIYRSHQQHMLIDKQAYDVHTATVMDWNDILYDMQSSDFIQSVKSDKWSQLEGTWEFKVHICLNRYGYFDCDGGSAGNNIIRMEFIKVCESRYAYMYPEKCNPVDN